MDGRFNNPFISEEENHEAEDQEEPAAAGITQDHHHNTSIILSSSPLVFTTTTTATNNNMIIKDHGHRHSKVISTTLASPKKSRRAIQKRVVTVPIGEVDGSRNNNKGEGAPPSDSWAWRKYGQKPIKGSPYPRGYYRCSSSKGCPARKQVERSRLDPAMLLITYACEHNHPWPASRNSSNHTTNNNKLNSTTTTATATVDTKNKFNQEEEDDEEEEEEEDEEARSAVVFGNPKLAPPPAMEEVTDHDDITFRDLGGEDSMIIAATSTITTTTTTITDDFGWFSDVASTSHTILDNPICLGSKFMNSNNFNEESSDDVAMIFPMMREEDESLFGDLGELPECSVVFRRGFFEKEEEERRRCSLRTASWCGSSG